MVNKRDFFSLSTSFYSNFSLKIRILSPTTISLRLTSSIISLLPIKTLFRYFFIRPLVKEENHGKWKICQNSYGGRKLIERDYKVWLKYWQWSRGQMNPSDIKEFLSWRQSQNQTGKGTLRRKRLMGLGKKKKKSISHRGTERKVKIKRRGQ